MSYHEDVVARIREWSCLWERLRQVVLCHPDRVDEVRAALDRAWLVTPVEVQTSTLLRRDQVVAADPTRLLREFRNELDIAYVRRELVPLVRAAEKVLLPAGRIEVARGLLRTSRTVEQALLEADSEWRQEHWGRYAHDEIPLNQFISEAIGRWNQLQDQLPERGR